MSESHDQKSKPYCMTIDPILFKALEDWRWANRLSRSKAMKIILETFLSNLKSKEKAEQQELNLK